MRSLRIITTFLLVALYVLVYLGTTVLFNFQRVLDDPENIKQAVQGRRLLDETVMVLIRKDLQDQPIFRDFPVIIRNSPALAQGIDSLIPDEWANAQTDQVVDSVFRYLESGNLSDLTITLEVAPIWSALRGEAGRRIVVASLESLPVCTLDQLPSIDLSTGNFEITVCMPPLVPVELVAGELHAIVAGVIDEKTATLIVGDQIVVNLIDLDPAPISESRGAVEDFRRFYLVSRIGVWFSFILPTVVLFFILVLSVRSITDLGLWVGGALLLSVIASFLVAILMRPILPLLLLGSEPSMVTSDIAGHVMDRILRVVLAGLIGQWQTRVFLQTGIMLIVSILFLATGSLSYLLSSRRHIASANHRT